MRRAAGDRGRRFKLGLQSAGRVVGWNTQGVNGLLNLRVQIGQRRGGGQDLSFLLSHVQVGDEADVVFRFRQLKGLILGGDVFIGDGHLALKAAEGDVVGGNVAEESDEDFTAIFDGGVEIGLGGFDAAAGAAEDVDFPGGVGAELVEIAFEIFASAASAAAPGAAEDVDFPGGVEAELVEIAFEIIASAASAAGTAGGSCAGGASGPRGSAAGAEMGA